MWKKKSEYSDIWKMKNLVKKFLLNINSFSESFSEYSRNTFEFLYGTYLYVSSKFLIILLFITFKNFPKTRPKFFLEKFSNIYSGLLRVFHIYISFSLLIIDFFLFWQEF